MTHDARSKSNVANKYAAIGWVSKALVEDRTAFLAWARMAVQHAAGDQGEVVKLREPVELEADPILDPQYAEMMKKGFRCFRAEGFVLGGKEIDES